MNKPMDIIGKKFNRLTVLEFVGTDKYGNTKFLCECDCGNRKVLLGSKVKGGRTKSCGCLHSETARNNTKKHLSSHTKLYSVYAHILSRCFCKTNKNYHNYGGRGITVCEEWADKEKGFDKFKEWAYQNGYDENAKFGNCTIDRINNDGNYEPSNCRWADIKTQANNKRQNHLITFNGKTQNVTQWATELGFTNSTLFNRIRKGWSVEETLTTSVKKYRRN
jgi:hypothetical protein